MPPRPRPRPRAILAPSSPVSVVGCEISTSAPARKSATEEEDEDEDDLFIRSKGRSLREVHQRAARAAQAAAVAQTSTPTGSDEEENEGEDTPKQHLGRTRRQDVFFNTSGKSKALPKWAKKGAIKTLLLGDSDSESENTRPSRGDAPSGKRYGGAGGRTTTPSRRNGKRARSRSRSQSLTPPPELTYVEKMRAQTAIQQALNSGPDNVPLRSAVAEVEDDGDEFDVGETMLDPALQHIAQAVRNRASKLKTNDSFGSTHHSLQDRSNHHSNGGAAMVAIRVRWVPHPQDKATRGRAQQSWFFNVKRHDTLKELLMQTSDKAHVLAEDLVLMRGGKQVFTSVSPEGLGFWDQGDLEACDRLTFDALRLRHFRSPTPAQQSRDDLESTRDVSAPPSEESVAADDADKFKLVLRAPGIKEVTLSVRSTTTCSKIVRAFLAVVAKQDGKAPASPRKAAQVRLCIDGEKQHPNTSMSDCDLEDGDMVEVVGL